MIKRPHYQQIKVVHVPHQKHYCRQQRNTFISGADFVRALLHLRVLKCASTSHFCHWSLQLTALALMTQWN